MGVQSLASWYSVSASARLVGDVGNLLDPPVAIRSSYEKNFFEAPHRGWPAPPAYPNCSTRLLIAVRIDPNHRSDTLGAPNLGVANISERLFSDRSCILICVSDIVILVERPPSGLSTHNRKIREGREVTFKLILIYFVTQSYLTPSWHCATLIA